MDAQFLHEILGVGACDVRGELSPDLVFGIGLGGDLLADVGQILVGFARLVGCILERVLRVLQLVFGGRQFLRREIQ